MRNRCGPMFEALEARQLMASTTPYLTNQCLPPPPTQPIPVFHSPLPPAPPPVSQPPLPPVPPVEAPSQPPSGKPPTDRPQTTPDVTNPAVMVGQWTGSHQDQRQNPGTLAFQVMMNSKGELYGKLKVTGLAELEYTAGVSYNRKTQRFTYYVLTPKMAVRYEGRLSIFSASTMDLQGTLQVITKKGAYRSTFSALKPYTP